MCTHASGSRVITDYHLIVGFIRGVENYSYGKSYCNNQFVNAADRAYINQKIDNEKELYLHLINLIMQ